MSDGDFGMNIRELVSTHLSMAVVASIVIVLFNVYTGEVTTILQIATDLLLHILSVS